MVTVFLCDDDTAMLSKYETMLQQTARKYRVEVKIATFKNGEQLIFWLSDSTASPDIIYLDVLMGKLNGLETARQLREMGCGAQLIFLTTSGDYVFESFDVSPLQYLIKDSITKEKFESVFLRAIEMVRTKKAEIFTCESGGVQYAIPLYDITFFEIVKRIVTVHFGEDETCSFYVTLSDLEEQMANRGFIRIHRSFIVNMQHIRKFHPKSLLMKNGKEIPVGVTYMERAKEAFYHYISEKAFP